MVNTFMCSSEDQLDNRGLIQLFYRRYVDDTVVTMPDQSAAETFLQTLNDIARIYHGIKHE